MKRNTLILTAFLLLSGFAFNQNYRTAIGIKGGYPFTTFNVKHMLGGKSAIEGSIGGGRHTLWLQGLYEINNDLGSGFNWYYGIGADLGFWTGDYHYHHPHNDRHYTGAYGGIDGVIGIEYTFNEIPINLALDAVPTIRVFPYVGFAMYGNIAIRFAIK